MPGKWLDVIGFGLAVIGSSLGVWGALLQANAYYPFAIRALPAHFWSVFSEFARKGQGEALNQIRVAAKLGEDRGEERTKSLLGLYLVLCGFFLNLVDAAVALAGALADSGAGK